MKNHLNVARTLARLLDRQFNFLGFRFGLDPIIGLIPGLGDILPVMVGSYLIWIGMKMQIPRERINEMIQNLIIDVALGFIPFFGDISDFVFKAHSKNLAILEEHAQTSFDKAPVIEGEIIR